MGLLDGLRILDMADGKGEYCGRLLAELGADVLRLEPPGGSRSRRLGPFAVDGKTSLHFAVRNAGKRGVVLDWRDPASHDELHALLETCDAWIESESPGALEEAGLAPADVLSRHPSLVLTSVSDFGQTGPYRDWLGTDMIGFAMGGMMHRAGIPEKPPLVAPGSLAYDAAGITAAYATLLALFQRIRGAGGQHVDVSVMESVGNLSDWALPHFSATGGAQHRSGAGMYTVYRCADGFVRMIILVSHHWRELLAWMGNPAELSDPELEQFIPRLMRQAEIDPLVERFFADQNKLDVAREAQRRGLPATPVLEPTEVLENEHITARGTFRSLPVGGGQQAKVPVGFVFVDGVRAEVASGPPELGEHTEEVRASSAPTIPKTANATRRPLEGLRVLDFGIGAVGVELGRLLAEYGADVLKVESSDFPDFIRTIMGTMMNPSFASSSRSKRGLGVDLKKARGLEIVEKLVRHADVFIENNAAGVMDRLGLGRERLRELNPKLVAFSSNMTGSQGPWAHWVGYGPSTHPLAGLQWLWNYPEDADQPAGSTNVHPDHLVGRVGAMAVLAGLIGRERSGAGTHVEVAQFETIVHMLGDLLAQESQQPGSVRPRGNASAHGCPWGAYPCAGDDEWCAINVRTDEEWARLRSAMGDPSWAAVGEFATVEGRRAGVDEIDRQLSQWTQGQESRQVMEGLQSAGVPAGVLFQGLHHASDPHLESRGYLRSIEQPDQGSLVLEGAAFHGALLGESRVSPAPRLGEHTREICRDWLGMDDAEIDREIADGILEVAPETSS
ncbi:MAG: CoA transferase [Myxococcota bacterium]|nr:CoA transferase [Myxococcota bacterium]